MDKLIRILIVGVVLGSASGVNAAPTLFVVPMDGQQEVPGPGDPDGTGTAMLTIDPIALTIDWNITVNNIDLPITGAHIHQAPFGEAGPIVVDLDEQLSGSGLADPDLAAVVASPSSYYVNVHNPTYPDGAIRGQLGCPVPVPSALGLVAMGLLSLRFSRRR